MRRVFGFLVAYSSNGSPLTLSSIFSKLHLPNYLPLAALAVLEKYLIRISSSLLFNLNSLLITFVSHPLVVYTTARRHDQLSQLKQKTL